MTLTLPPRDRPPTVAAGWCVRLDWPDATHSFALYLATENGAAQRLAGLQRFWAPGPVRPDRYRVVPISRHDWQLHARRPRCASPDCPTAETSR